MGTKEKPEERIVILEKHIRDEGFIVYHTEYDPFTKQFVIKGYMEDEE